MEPKVSMALKIAKAISKMQQVKYKEAGKTARAFAKQERKPARTARRWAWTK